MKDLFNDIWKRIKNETKINNLTELAKDVESTQQYVSKKKKTDDFPVKWAYLVAKKYNLSTEWIMTGEGPKRLHEQSTRAKTNNDFFQLLDEWLSEIARKEPERKDWVRCQIVDSLPAFKEWLKRREEEEGEDTNFPSSKVA